MKLALLQHEMQTLSKDLSIIQDIITDFNDMTSQKDMDSIDFLLKSKLLNESIEFITSKAFKVEIDVVPYDLPRELKDKREKLEKYKAQKELLDFKDRLI